MYKEVLSKKQVELLFVMEKFKREYYLVGGTAIALYLGHRRSIDFDMFKRSPLNHKKNLDKLNVSGFPYRVTRRVEEQMNLIINDVKLTFFQYPFEIKANEKFENTFRVPALIDLAAMKAYALGRRSKWKDYVDLFFLLTEHFSIGQISARANTIFGDLYSEKLFRSQLCYFGDIDYTEQVDYLFANPPSDETIKATLTKMAVEI